MKNNKRLKLSSKGNEKVFSVLGEKLRNKRNQIYTDHRRLKRVYSRLHPKFYMLFVNYGARFCTNLQYEVNRVCEDVVPLMELVTESVWNKLYIERVSKKEVYRLIAQINGIVKDFIANLPVVCTSAMSRYIAELDAKDNPDGLELKTVAEYAEELEKISGPDNHKRNTSSVYSAYSTNPLLARFANIDVSYMGIVKFDKYFAAVQNKTARSYSAVYDYALSLEETYDKAIGGESSRWFTLSSPYMLERLSSNDRSDYKSHLKIKNAFHRLKEQALKCQFYAGMPSGNIAETLNEFRELFVSKCNDINDLYYQLADMDTVDKSRALFIEAYHALIQLQTVLCVYLCSKTYILLCKVSKLPYTQKDHLSGYDILTCTTWLHVSLPDLNEISSILGYLPINTHNHYKRIGSYY